MLTTYCLQNKVNTWCHRIWNVIRGSHGSRVPYFKNKNSRHFRPARPCSARTVCAWEKPSINLHLHALNINKHTYKTDRKHPKRRFKAIVHSAMTKMSSSIAYSIFNPSICCNSAGNKIKKMLLLLITNRHDLSPPTPHFICIYLRWCDNLIFSVLARFAKCLIHVSSPEA